MRNTDRIRQLDLALVSQSCCYDILCNVTCCICCGTVYLGAVLSGECAAAVTSVTTVGVYDDLTAGQTTVSVRSANGCGILPAVCVWGETAGWSVFPGVFQRKDRIFLGSYGAGGGGHVISADVPVGQRRL